MNTLYKDLIYLLSCAVNGITPDTAKVQAMDLERLYRLAKLHTVRAAVCIALKRAGVHDKQFDQAYKKAVRKNIYLDMERTAILSDFEKQGIWYMPLKGSILKDWYPKPGMREMADNDILFDSFGRKQVRELFQNRGYKTVSFRKGNHDTYEKPPIYNFEMHVSLFQWTYKKLNEQYENVKENLLPVDGTAYQFTFTPEDFYVFALAHAYKHYCYSRTGIRTLTDIYVMNRHLSDLMDRDEVEKKLTHLGIAEYEQHNRMLAEKLFSSVRPLEEIELTEDEKEMLLYYCDMTTYRTGDDRINNHLHELQENSEGITLRTKLKYCCVRLFPGKGFCKFDYPFVYKHPWTLPFFWVWRIVHKGITNRKKVKQELVSLRKHK